MQLTKHIKKIFILFVFITLFTFLFSCSMMESNKEQYTIIFNGNGGTLVSGKEIQKVSNPSEIIAPVYEKDGFTFKGFDKNIDSLNNDAVVNALWESNAYYTVTFKDYDGTILQTSNVKGGDIPTYNKSNPTKANDDNYLYIFTGWEPQISEVTEDVVYIAKYKEQLLPYNISINLDGGTSNTTKLQFRTNVVTKDLLPFDVKKKGYAFKGYELNGIKVYDEKGNEVNNYQLSDNMVFKAIYIESVTLTVYYTLYNPKTNKIIETFDIKPLNMGNVSETRSYNYNTYVDLFAYPNEGYTFIGWYNDGQVLSNEKDYKYMMWDKDFTIEARFKYTLYDLKVKPNNNDLGQVMIKNGNSQIFYNEEMQQKYFTESVTIVAYSKTDTRRFLGWYNENNELVSTNAIHTFNMINRNYTLEAKWDYFKVTYDLDEGTNNSNNPTYYTVDMQNITLLEPTKEGYTFIGWEYNGNIITEINTSNICHMTLKALWTYYTLTTNINNANVGTVSQYNNVKITKGELVTITATAPLDGYTFNGWYDGDKLVSSELTYTFNMPNTNLVYTAIYTPNKYTITIDNQAEGVSIDVITSGCEYDFDSRITLSATNIPAGYTIKWVRSDGVEYNGDSYSFNVPAINITITTVTTLLYTRNGNKIYFGSYPQTLVTDNSLISELNTLAGNKPTSSNKYKWTDYNYYISSSVTSYMYYQDIDLDSDGEFDYRGVYFTQYRPYYYSSSSSTGNSYQDENGYSTNTIYWFNYDPIEWDILEESDGKALIIANLILDSQEYYPSKSTSKFTHNGASGYANNYELSNIRKFLNDNFYDTAFNDLQKSIIETTLVDNSKSSTGNSSNSYVCNNTNDKVFLLSIQEATTYYTIDTSRQAKGTDYAKAQGLGVYIFWWLRSPDGLDANCAWDVHDYGHGGYSNVPRTDIGIRPACWINLK